MPISIEQFQAQAQLVTDLYMQVLALQHENTQLREKLQANESTAKHPAQ